MKNNPHYVWFFVTQLLKHYYKFSRSDWQALSFDHYSSSGFDFHSSCLLFKRSVFYGGPNVTSKYIFPLFLKKDLSLTKNCRELLSDSYNCRELLLDSYNCVLTVKTVLNCFPTVMTASRQLYFFICLNLYLPLV